VRRLVACALVALLFAAIGPRIVGPRSHSAGAKFEYEPPEGFVPVKQEQLGTATVPGVEGARAWTLEEKKNFDGTVDRSGTLTRVVLHHSPREMSVEEADLAALVLEMPKAFEEAQCTWVHRRHELRTRSDGARVGLIEGDCDRDVDLSKLGMRSQTVKSRKLQLMFPDDSGTSIVTISYPTDQAAKWEPLFEATIGKARGVATRAPMPAPWTYAAWATGGLVIGWLGTAILARRSSPPPAPAPSPKASKIDAKREEEEEEEEEEAEA